MTALTKFASALGLAALLAAPSQALAQGRGFGMMGMGNGPMVNLLANPAVQKELKLDDSQVEKVNALAATMRDKMQAARDELQGLDQAERQKKMQEINKSMAEESKKGLAGVLKPEQEKRFQQISLQQRGAYAMADPEVQKDLKLTDAQKEKVQTTLQDSQEKMREIFQSAGGDREAAREKMTAFRKELSDKLQAQLNDDQKKTYKEMLGSPFEVPPFRPNN